MTDSNSPVVETQMLIRKPAAEVFRALADHAVTTQFWFTKSSGKLEQGKTVTWEWEMYGASTKVFVKEIVENKKIVIEWGEPVTTVEFIFNSLEEARTYVVIRNYGFSQTGPALIEVIKDATGGFTTVLDGLKAYLEHNINLNLIRDKFPDKVKK